MSTLVRFGFGFLLVFAALFLIALVLIQRGRGGGLAGAFGGAGGQSAFGTKAGDVFTKITVVVAACWILLCILAINMLGRSQSLFSPTLGGSAGQAVPARTPAADAASDAAASPAATPDATTDSASAAAAASSPAAEAEATGTGSK
jgi:preprotein translocase subunit SecG